MFARVASSCRSVYLTAMRDLEPGDRFPDFVLPELNGKKSHLYSRVGGRPVLLFMGSSLESEQKDLIKTFADRCDVVTVLTNHEESGAGLVYIDEGREVAEGDTSRSCLLDRNLRVLVKPEKLTFDRIAAAIEISIIPQSNSVTSQAPVLILDRVLAEDRCHFLMDLWERSGAVETGVEQSTTAGRSEVLSEQHKSRRDHTVEDAKLIRLLTQSIGKKLLPEIERAFIYKPNRFEGFKIACYNADDAGFFDTHRDNISSNTAHRRLAVSLNLNHVYEGGELRFPEFSDVKYRPAAGSALVFSCAHLHEVLPVTSGRRFTLLTFLYDETVERWQGGDPFGF